MLQINTGKLFTLSVERVNRLTGVLYSNLRLPHGRDIQSSAGTLRSTGFGPTDLALVYEINEQIELVPTGPGALASHTVRPYLEEFAVVAAFGLGGIVGQSEAAVRALSDGRPGRSANGAPSEYVSRVFDQTIYLTAQDVDEFEEFVAELVALQRKSYLGAMRAMHTFIAGLCRIPDDLAQAYTLMVSALEYLAQDFDSFLPTWADVEDRKRRALDNALAGVNETAATALRDAVLSHEHVAIARRYRAFALSHIDADFFRRPTKSNRPIARNELDAALRSAYNFRSLSVHRGRSLPDPITMPFGNWESTTIERRPALTLEGLSRITRHVIRRFVATQPKMQTEVYDYSRERSGIVFMEMAPQYWIGLSFLDPAHARKRLEGFIGLVCSVMMHENSAQLVDMRPMLVDVERLLPQAPHQHKLAMFSISLLFNVLVPVEQKSPGFDTFYERHSEEIGTLGIETLAVASLLNLVDDWEIEDHAAMLEQYFDERNRPSGLHLPRLAEAAMCLTLAEKFRFAKSETRVHSCIARAVEAHPGCERLRLFEKNFAMDATICWRQILLPPRIGSTDLSTVEATIGEKNAPELDQEKSTK